MFRSFLSTLGTGVPRMSVRPTTYSSIPLFVLLSRCPSWCFRSRYHDTHSSFPSKMDQFPKVPLRLFSTRNFLSTFPSFPAPYPSQPRFWDTSPSFHWRSDFPVALTSLAPTLEDTSSPFLWTFPESWRLLYLLVSILFVFCPVLFEVTVFSPFLRRSCSFSGHPTYATPECFSTNLDLSLIPGEGLTFDGYFVEFGRKSKVLVVYLLLSHDRHSTQSLRVTKPTMS